MNLRLVALLGLALLAVPISHRVARELRATRTVGEVTAIVEHGEGDDTTYEPEITYPCRDGTRATLHGISISPPLYAVGEQIDILVDGDDASFGSPLARWWPWALAVLACLAVCFDVRVPLRLRPQLFGIAAISGLVVVAGPDRAAARGCVGIAATALTALALIALRQATCRRCRGDRECRCDEVTLPMARVTSR